MQISRRTFLLSTLLAPLAVLAIMSKPDSLLKSWSELNYGGKVIYHGYTDEKAVALTFDDGPDPRFTPQVLEILTKYKVPATFFVVGAQVERYPDLVREQVALGHELANHTYSHPELTKVALPEVFAEIQKDQLTILRFTGTSPSFFRPPKKLYNQDIIKLAGNLGLPTVLWTVCIENHSVKTPEAMARRVIGQAKKGGIILGHDGRLDRQKTVDALPAIIEGYQKKGYRFVTLSELLNGKASPKPL